MFSFNLTTLLDQNKKNNKHMYASIYNSTRIVPIDIKNMIGWLIRTETYILNIIYVDTISPLSDNFKNPHIIKKNFGIDEFSHPFSLTTAVYHIDNLFSLNDPNTLFFLKNLRNTLFIFNSGGFNSWKEISNKINKNSGLTVRGGSKNIRSLISPLQFRLCQTLLTMNIKVNDIISGFYTDEDNRFNSLDKKLFNNPKRSYHTISNNFKPYNKSFPLNSYNRSWFYNQNSKKNIRLFSTFSDEILDICKKNSNLDSLFNSAIYDRLNVIINSDNDNHTKQLKLEEELINYNKNAFDKLKTSPNLFYGDTGLKFLLETIKLLENDLEDCKKDSRIFTKNFKDVIYELDNSTIVSIVLSTVIPSIYKYRDSTDSNKIIKLYPIYKKIGSKLVFCYIEKMYDKYKNHVKSFSTPFKFNININPTPSEFEFDIDTSLESFSKNIKDIFDSHEEYYIKLGFKLVLFFSDRSGLFSIENEIINKEHTIAQLIPADNLDEKIINYLSNDDSTYPMVCSPDDWEISITKNEYKIIKQGGFLSQNFKKNKFIQSNPKNKGLTKLYNDHIVNTINYIQSINYIINKDVLKIILKNINLGILDDLILLNIHPETSNIMKLISKKEKSLVKSILKHNTKSYIDRIILTNAILYRNSDLFFPVFIDFRGRLYTSTPSFSFQGSELIKSLLLFKKGFVLNESGLKSLKLYIASCYGYDKISNIDKIKWVDDNIDKIIDIDNNFWLNGKNILLSLASSLEMKKYLENPLNFKSNLPIYIDATCNGITASFIND
uniref:DNA-directed RNA polymerase n=1 Tax=Arthrobotrys musiformis TaxID=47236 RepID=A0A482EBJ1_9PEZI|nr:hypothetical protein [Arthrobotrys musiformis]